MINRLHYDGRWQLKLTVQRELIDFGDAISRTVILTRDGLRLDRRSNHRHQKI
jgi:hypothetical protein